MRTEASHCLGPTATSHFHWLRDLDNLVRCSVPPFPRLVVRMSSHGSVSAEATRCRASDADSCRSVPPPGPTSAAADTPAQSQVSPFLWTLLSHSCWLPDNPTVHSQLTPTPPDPGRLYDTMTDASVWP